VPTPGKIPSSTELSAPGVDVTGVDVTEARASTADHQASPVMATASHPALGVRPLRRQLRTAVTAQMSVARTYTPSHTPSPSLW